MSTAASLGMGKKNLRNLDGNRFFEEASIWEVSSKPTDQMVMANVGTYCFVRFASEILQARGLLLTKLLDLGWVEELVLLWALLTCQIWRDWV
jgi:hypothetical protein